MSALAGTGSLLRLALRLERVRLPIWILGISGIVVVTGASIGALYSRAADLLALASTIIANPALRALAGPVFAPDTVGGLTAWRVTVLAATLTGLMNIFLVVRHTRAEEESGRAELLGSTVQGRLAPLAATTTLALGVNLVLGALIAGGLAAQGLPGAGALAMGTGIAAAGWVFAGVATVAAQLTASARTARGIAATVLGAAFLVRAIGDAADQNSDLAALSWLSPLGWATQMHAFAGERWWVLGLLAAAALLLMLGGALLAASRDLGAGVFPARRGRSAARPSLRGPFSLAWRLQAGTVLGWTIAFAVAGALFGALAESVGGIVDSTPQLAEIFARLGGPGAVVDRFLATEMGVFGILAGAFAIQAVIRLRTEELQLRAEPVLATPTSRTRWMLSHTSCALIGATLTLTAAGLVMGLVHGMQVGDVTGQTGRLLAAALVQVPAAWVVAGAAATLFGLLPRLTGLSWGLLLVFFLLGQLGQLFQIDQRVRDLSPYAHVPQLPAEPFTIAPTLSLSAVALLLGLLGLAGFARRDLDS